jgi:hypothetical protein
MVIVLVESSRDALVDALMWPGEVVVVDELDDDMRLWLLVPRLVPTIARRARDWIEKVIQEERGADWRTQAGVEMDEGRGLGTMEGNVAQILARRMKGKGMSWSKSGAGAMAKVRELLVNGELDQWCGRQVARECSVQKPTVRATTRKKRDQGEWLQAGVPALYGPSASKPWAKALRQVLHPLTC